MIGMALLLAAAGIYTNEEQVYFLTAAKLPAPPWVGIAVAADGAAQRIDAYGKPMAGPVPGDLVATTDGYSATIAGSPVPLKLQKARAWTCWASLPKRAKAADGSEDWWFGRGLVLHDRGGRVLVSTDETPPQQFSLRMRNVVWPRGPNQPSLVLYVHKANYDHAESYSWADPGAKRIGINLRWMQASCALVE